MSEIQWPPAVSSDIQWPEQTVIVDSFIYEAISDPQPIRGLPRLAWLLKEPGFFDSAETI